MLKIVGLYIFLQLPIWVFAQPTSRTGYIATGNLKLYYEKAGHGPTLVFIHGGYLDLHFWDRQTLYFSKNYTVVRIDLPGHGHTTGLDSTLKIQDVIRVMMDSLHIKKASFAGLSLGASCVIDFALAYPDRVNKLVLTSSGLSGWDDVMKFDALSKKLFIHLDSVSTSKDRALIIENFTHLWCDGPFRKPQEVSPVIRNYVFNTAMANVNDNSYWPVFNKDKAAKRIHTIRKPVLILAGSLDVPFILSVARYLHSKLPQSQLHIIKGCAHMVNLEKPVLFERYVSVFLGK